MLFTKFLSTNSPRQNQDNIGINENIAELLAIRNNRFICFLLFYYVIYYINIILLFHIFLINSVNTISLLFFSSIMSYLMIIIYFCSTFHTIL